MSWIICTECGTHLPANAEVCSECGYPVIGRWREATDATQAALKEYRLIQYLGAAATCGGLVAAFADSPFAAMVSITVGIATFLTGLLGAWWNTGD